MSLCEVYDDKFDANYLHEIFSIIQGKLKYKANNVTNPTTWPYGGTGSHRLFGSRIFCRHHPNIIDYLDNENASTFFDIFEFLCNLKNIDSRNIFLQRIDVNLQHSGCNGTLHQDSAPWDKDSKTIMIMPNPIWDKEWGGQFQLFCEDKSQMIEEYDYVPGRILVFPSYLPHRGLGPNIEYPYVYRYSIVFGVQ